MSNNGSPKRKPLGRLWLAQDKWTLTCDPHVAMALKRVFPRVQLDGQVFTFEHEPLTCFELEWFAQRYPLSILPADELAKMARRYEQHQAEWEAIRSPRYKPQPRALAITLRNYQGQAVDLYAARKALLLGDDVGLGKTACAIGSFCDTRTLPAVVITYGHLQRQWENEIRRFLPSARVHIIRKRQHYDVAYDFTRHVKGKFPDVILCTYGKLDAWWYPLFYTYKCQSLVFDEVQELRRDDSDKYRAAKAAAVQATFCLGLSATPIYNQGGEMYNVMDVIEPGALGERDEFKREWCKSSGDHAGKWVLKDPVAFGSYLQSENMMLRRTREQVGRELPPVSRYTQAVDADEGMGGLEKGTALELAKLILASDKKGRGVDFKAAGEFDALLRRATGMVKAAAVADFVKLLIAQGEPVILGGWHHSVYDVWRDKLKDCDPVFFTGQESVAAKNKGRDKFLAGDTKLMILSNRAAVGIEGLQGVCRNVVFGELDWSPGPHKQFIGRVHRDGQSLPVFVYFLYTDWGSDPLMVEVLGLKEEQHRGVNDPWASSSPVLDDRAAYLRVKQLAQHYLERFG